MWSSNDCRDALAQAVATVDGPLRIADYRAWRQAQPDRQPNDGTIVHRLGPWIRAVRSVGGRTTYFTAEDCLKALQQAARDLGLIELRQDDYQAWAAESPERPEKQTIRHHLGAWHEALVTADLVPGRMPDDFVVIPPASRVSSSGLAS